MHGGDGRDGIGLMWNCKFVMRREAWLLNRERGGASEFCT